MIILLTATAAVFGALVGFTVEARHSTSATTFRGPVAGAVAASPDGRWSVIRLPARQEASAHPFVGSIACPDQGRCAISAGPSTFVSHLYRFEGDEALGRISDFDGGWSLQCPTRSRCFALPNTQHQGYLEGHMMTSGDGGAHWAPASSSPSSPFLTSLSCGSATFCIGESVSDTGTRAWSTHDAGRTWKHLPPEATNDETWCFSSTSCVGFTFNQDTLTNDVAITHDGGQTWVSLRSPGIGGSEITSLWCTDGRHCVMGTNDGNPRTTTYGVAWTDDGGWHWSHHPLLTMPTPPQSGYDGFAVSCSTTARCYALLGKPTGTGFFVNQAYANQGTLARWRLVSTWESAWGLENGPGPGLLACTMNECFAQSGKGFGPGGYAEQSGSGVMIWRPPG